MSRPGCLVAVVDVTAEKRPRFTPPSPGIASLVRRVGDAAGLTRMGVALREVQPGLAGSNRHFQLVEKEWTYVVSDEGTVRIGPHRLAVTAGDFVADRRVPLVLLEGGERPALALRARAIPRRASCGDP